MKKDHQRSADTRRTVTPRDIAEQYRGAVRLAPGVWLDGDGDLHFSIPELLVAFELADTPENRELLASDIAEFMGQWMPVTMIRQDTES